MKKKTIKITQEELQRIVIIAMAAQHSKECGNPKFKSITSKEVAEEIWEKWGDNNV